MTYCTNCGCEEKPNHIFCSQCGTKVQRGQLGNPMLTPQVDRKVLDNLKKGRTTPRFLCLDCGYAGPAIRVRTKINWPASIGAFFIFVLPSLFAPSLAFLSIIWLAVFALTTSRVMKCPKCEKETSEKGFNLKRY